MREPELCAAGKDTFAVADYLAGRMSEERAESFEQHVLECPRCSHDLTTAALLRGSRAAGSAAARTAPAGPASWRRARWYAVPLAAAASVALAVGVATWLRPAPPGQPPAAATDALRGSEVSAAGLDVEIHRNGERLEVSWPDVPAAASYLVEVLDADADDTPVLSREAVAPPVVFELAELGSLAELARRSVRVAALDRVGQEIVASQELRLAPFAVPAPPHAPPH